MLRIRSYLTRPQLSSGVSRIYASMNVEVISESSVDLDEYARVSIGFTVAEVLDDAAVDAALRGAPIAAVPLEVPYEKNYDSQPCGRTPKFPHA